MADPPTTGKLLDFTKTYFGHDFSYTCGYPDKHSEPGLHEIIGWATPHPEVGDVILGLVHQPEGASQTGKLLVLGVKPQGIPPEVFTAAVREVDED